MEQLNINQLIINLTAKANEGIALIKDADITSKEFDDLMANIMNSISIINNKAQLYPQVGQDNEAKDLVGMDYLSMEELN